MEGAGQKQRMEERHLVSDGNTALPSIEDGQLVGLSVGVHDDLQEALVLLAAAV